MTVRKEVKEKEKEKEKEKGKEKEKENKTKPFHIFSQNIFPNLSILNRTRKSQLCFLLLINRRHPKKKQQKKSQRKTKTKKYPHDGHGGWLGDNRLGVVVHCYLVREWKRRFEKKIKKINNNFGY